MPSQEPADALTLTGEPVFDEAGLIPAICQDAVDGTVLMMAWMNADALAKTLTTRRATFWSRSRQELWVKGATSGNVLQVESVRLDCDRDALLVLVSPAGPACHTGTRSCWGDDAGPLLSRLAGTIAARRGADPATSYVARLLAADRDVAAGKVAEEAAEVLEAAPGSDHQAEEAADVLFHLLVLLARDGTDPLRVLDVLAEREGLPPRWLRD
ncbi:MAG: bifunctional phosphoribosyl-AMP cyclohydrolase/phosphoribosyl-ATP diphosphatase HisIE [Actinomycetota bacterium]